MAAAAQEDLTRLYSEAQQAQAAGDLPTATRKYEAIVRLRPQMAEAHANLGNLYYQQGQAARAKTAYQEAIRLKPDLAGPHFFLGVIAFGAHDYPSALRHLQRAEASDPANALIHSHLGYTHYARSEFREAAAEFQKAAAPDAGNIDVLYHLSKSYGHLAEDSLTQLQGQFPDSVYTSLARAHLAETKNDWKEAGEQYTLALAKMPANTHLREKLKWIEAKGAGSTSQPMAAGDELIDGSLAYRDSPPSGPKLKEAMTHWQARVVGLMQDAQGDQRIYLAAEAYQVLSYFSLLAVLEVDPDSYRAHQLRAQLLEASNNDEGAIEEYRNVLRRKPDLHNIHFAIGSLYWKDQQFDKARPELEEELRINPNHPHALYELGDLSAFRGDAQNAEKFFLQALKLEPGMVEVHLALEKLYTESGRYDKALEQLRTVLRIDASDPTPHYRLALIYRKMGETRNADRELAIFKQKQSASRK